VVLFHVYSHWHIDDIGIVRNGQLFVDLFFVISGFVIAHIYGPRLRDREQLLQFAVFRTARLYPLHLFMLLVVAAYLLAMHWIGWGWHAPGGDAYNPLYAASTFPKFIENLFLVQGLLPQSGSFNRQSWSISTEYYTYFMFAVCVFSMRARPRLLVLTFAGLAALTLSYLLWDGNLVVSLRLVRCMAGFFIGVLVYGLWQRWYGSVAGFLGDGWRMELAEVVVAALVVVVMWSCRPDRTSLLVLPVFALSVFMFAQGRGMVARVLDHPLMQRLGKWSYSIYMVHYIIILMIMDISRSLFRDGPRAFARWPAWESGLLVLAFVGIVLAASSLSYRWIETPPRRWAKRWAARRGGRSIGEDEEELAGAP
jgi:hypothetical protein